jgi:phage head maturation protease
MTTDIEYLTTPGNIELRSGSRAIGGRAFTFGTVSADLGGFVETVAPSFCDRTVATNFAHIICRYNHDSNLVLGSTDNKTLVCAVDSRGLDYTVPEVPEWPGPPYVLDMVRRGDLSSSFTFRVDPGGEGDRWERRSGKPLRTLIKGTILDVSPVDIPAYPTGTSVAMRSLAHHMSAPIEDVLALSERGELDKFFVRSDRPAAPAPARTSRSELVETLAEQFPEVRHVGKDGKQALQETLAARFDPKARLLQSMAARWPAYLTEAIDQSTEAPSVEDQLEAARADLRRDRNEVARLSDPVLIEREAARAELERAEQRAQDTLDALSGQLSGAAALRLSMEARPEGVSSYVPRTETPTEETPAEPEIPAQADPPRRWVPPQRRTMTGAEALRILDSMRPALPYQTAASVGLDECY